MIKYVNVLSLFTICLKKCDVYMFPCSCLWPNYNLNIFWLMILVVSWCNLDWNWNIFGGHNMWHQLEKKCNIYGMLHICLLDNLQYWAHNLISDEALVYIFPCFLIKPTLTSLTVVLYIHFDDLTSLGYT